MSTVAHRIALGIVTLLLAACIVMLLATTWIWITDPGQGTVTSQEFSEAHGTLIVGKVIIPAKEDTWIIWYRNDQGLIGSRSFDHDVFKQYPVGSHYP